MRTYGEDHEIVFAEARVCENFFEVTSYISWIKGDADFSCEPQAGVVPTRSL